MKRLAFTLTEVLVVVGIVILLTAISYPILSRAIGSSKQSVTISNLRQLAVAASIYRSSWSEAESGTWQQVGLPPDLSLLDVDPQLMKTIGPTKRGLMMLYTFQGWDVYSANHSGSSVILGDLSWTDPNNNLEDDKSKKIAFGAFLDTHVARRIGPGDWTDLEWWSTDSKQMK